MSDCNSPFGKEDLVLSLKTTLLEFYDVQADIDGEYFTLNELLNDEKVKENNSDIIEFIKDYYNF